MRFRTTIIIPSYYNNIIQISELTRVMFSGLFLLGGIEMVKNRSTRAAYNWRRTVSLEEIYAKEISECYKNSTIYSQDTTFSNPVMAKVIDLSTAIVIAEMDTVSALCKYHDEKTAVLNFASYCNPGGGFLKGSKAQEESLCEESFLYNVLSKHEGFYSWNKHHRNKLLYLNRAIYTPDIIFDHDQMRCHADVITCAAPNKCAAKKNNDISDDQNSKVLRNRISFILKIAQEQKVNTLILGAFGCGVFGQDPEEVAQIFKDCLKEFPALLNKVIFAIPGGMNLKAFQKIFELPVDHL